MTLISEANFFFKRGHRGSGSSTGIVATRTHFVLPVRSGGFFSVHTGISRVQATTDGPVGAAIGVMIFGNTDFGPDPAGWAPVIAGNVGSWTTAFQVTKGDMSVWESFRVWV